MPSSRTLNPSTGPWVPGRSVSVTRSSTGTFVKGILRSSGYGGCRVELSTPDASGSGKSPQTLTVFFKRVKPGVYVFTAPGGEEYTISEDIGFVPQRGAG